jgi:hypothetical protein
MESKRAPSKALPLTVRWHGFVRRWLNEFAPPRELKRWPTLLAVLQF